MKTLRVSGRAVQADVVIGANEYGSAVTVRVELDRKDPELLEAIVDLEALLRRRAFSLVSSSMSELEIQREVQERLQSQLATERERIKKNATHEVAEELRQEKNVRLRTERELATERDRVARLRSDLAQAKLDAGRQEP